MKRSDIKVGTHYAASEYKDWEDGGYRQAGRFVVLDAGDWTSIHTSYYTDNRAPVTYTWEGVQFTGKVAARRKTYSHDRADVVLGIYVNAETGTALPSNTNVVAMPLRNLRTTWEDGKARMDLRRKQEQARRDALQAAREDKNARLEAIAAGLSGVITGSIHSEYSRFSTQPTGRVVIDMADMERIVQALAAQPATV